MSEIPVCTWCVDNRHPDCDRYDYLPTGCGCTDPYHDDYDPDDDGDTQYADPGEAGGNEGATW